MVVIATTVHVFANVSQWYRQVFLCSIYTRRSRRRSPRV